MPNAHYTPAHRGAGGEDTFAKFKTDIKRLSKEDRSFAGGIFRHRCPRDQRLKVLNVDQCKKAIEDCKRKITIPPSAVSLLADLFATISEGQDTVDVNQFLAILSRMLNDTEAARRHRNRKHGLDSFEGGVAQFKRVASNFGHNVGTFLGVVESGEADPALEIFQERQRRLSQRRTMDRRRGQSSDHRSMRYKALKMVPRLPGSNLFEADYDDDPEERPLDLGEDAYDAAETEASFSHLADDAASGGVSFAAESYDVAENQITSPARRQHDESTGTPNSKRGAPPPLPGEEGDFKLPPRDNRPRGETSGPPLPGRDGAPPLPGRDSAPPLPGRDGAPPLPGRDGAPPLPSRDGAPPLPGRDGAPPLPGHDMGAPPLPDRDAGAPPLPGRDMDAPPLPGRNNAPPSPRRDPSAPPLPGDDLGAPPLPDRSRESSLVGDDSGPPLPSRDPSAPPLPNRDPSAPPLPSRDGKSSRVGFDSPGPPLPARGKTEEHINLVPLPKRDYKDKHEFIESKEEAIEYYRRRAAKEKAGTDRKKDKKSEEKEAEESFKNARTKSVKDRIRQKFIKKKIETMPVFSPWMIYLLTYSQLIVIIILVYRGIFEKIAFIPQYKGYNLSTLIGANGYEQTGYFQAVNFWIGPSVTKLIHHGVTFAPCMRKDQVISSRYRKIHAIDNLRKSGCCVKTIANIGRGIVTTDRKCNNLYAPGSTFYAKTCESLRNQRVVANDHSACCYGLQGHCQMLNLHDCSSVGGVYHRNRTCVQVNCLRDLCGFGGLEATAAIPYEPANPNQWWRFFTSLFVHRGIIHVVVVTAAQMYIGRRIERSAGWLRIGLIYIVSGMMSNVAAAYTDPYNIMTGASGSLCGLLAVLFVELFNMWTLVKDPFNELSSLCFYLAIIFVVGTLPGLNNFAHLAGFVFGLLMAVLLLPYVSFGKWGIRRKRILAAISFIVLLILIITLLLFFSLIQSSEFCEKCQTFNCIDFTTGFCAKFQPPDASSAVLYSPGESLFYQNEM